MAIHQGAETVNHTEAANLSTPSMDLDSAMIGSDCLEQSSQSKLTQQELSELQKATNFDKKELQQWYKGKRNARAAHLYFDRR